MKNSNATNNEALMENLGEIFTKVMSDEMSLAKADTLCNVAGKIQKSLEIKLRYFAEGFNANGEKAAAI